MYQYEATDFDVTTNAPESEYILKKYKKFLNIREFE